MTISRSNGKVLIGQRRASFPQDMRKHEQSENLAGS
jgi:hypothetical protein